MVYRVLPASRLGGWLVRLLVVLLVLQAAPVASATASTQIPQALAGTPGLQAGAALRYIRGDGHAAGVGQAVQTVVSVRASGAIGNGIADDTAALQAAINAAPENSILDFGGLSDIYKISATLRLRSNLVYRGRATIRLADRANTSMLAIAAGQNIVLQGLTLDGNKANQSGEHFGIVVSNDAGHNDNILIQGLSIRNIAGRGIRVGMLKNQFLSTRVRIENNFFDGTMRHAINVNRNAPGVIVQGNVIKNTDYSDFSNGIWIGNHSPGAVVSGNYLENISDIGIELWNSKGQATVTNNTIVGTRNFGISLATAPNSVVSGNQLSGIAGLIGIEVAYSDNVAVTGNAIGMTVGNSARRGAGQQRGVAVNRSHNVSLTRNTIGGGDVGVRITHGSQNTTIREVVVDRPSRFGIEVATDGEVVRGLVVANSRFISPGKKTYVCTGGSVDGLTFQDNVVQDPIGAPLEVGSARNVTLLNNSTQYSGAADTE